MTNYDDVMLRLWIFFTKAKRWCRSCWQRSSRI